MATLQNLSSTAARWRTFNLAAPGTLVAVAEIDLPPGGSSAHLHAQGAFNAEVRRPELVTNPPDFANGDFAGLAYGQPVRGRWDAATGRLSFTRELGAGVQQAGPAAGAEPCAAGVRWRAAHRGRSWRRRGDARRRQRRARVTPA